MAVPSRQTEAPSTAAVRIRPPFILLKIIIFDSQTQGGHLHLSIVEPLEFPPPRLFFLRGFGRTFLYSTSAAEGVEHGVIALMARILEILIAGFLRKRERDFERSHVGL